MYKNYMQCANMFIWQREESYISPNKINGGRGEDEILCVQGLLCLPVFFHILYVHLTLCSLPVISMSQCSCVAYWSVCFRVFKCQQMLLHVYLKRNKIPPKIIELYWLTVLQRLSSFFWRSTKIMSSEFS